MCRSLGHILLDKMWKKCERITLRVPILWRRGLHSLQLQPWKVKVALSIPLESFPPRPPTTLLSSLKENMILFSLDGVGAFIRPEPQNISPKRAVFLTPVGFFAIN